MKRIAKDGAYLEPGEIAVLVDLIRRQTRSLGRPGHPNELMLKSLATVLSEMVDGPGVLINTAPSWVIRQAAQAYVLQRGPQPHPHGAPDAAIESRVPAAPLCSPQRQEQQVTLPLVPGGVRDTQHGRS